MDDENKAEANAVRKVMGVLDTLPSVRAKHRVMWYVRDYLDERDATSKAAADARPAA